MEFAWNTQKNKMSDIKGKENEQDRKGKISNIDIDLDKTYLNYDLVKSELNLYQRVKKRVEEVRLVSRVQKNSVVNYSNIITVNQEQFKEWGIEKSKNYLEEVYNYFCDEFGKENVVSAKVHLDETTPHMHLHFVPVNKENGKLQARIVMDRKRINTIHDTAPKYLSSKGFDVVRGSGKTKENLDIHKYKVEQLRNESEALENKIIALKETDKTLNEIKTKKLLPGILSIYEKDFNFLKSKLIESEELKIENKKQKSEIDNLQNSFFIEKSLNDKYSKEIYHLEEEEKHLKKLKKINPNIQIEIDKAKYIEKLPRKSNSKSKCIER